MHDLYALTRRINGSEVHQEGKIRSDIERHRRDYLSIYAHAQAGHEKLVLSSSVDFLWDLMTEREKRICLRSLHAPVPMRRSLHLIDAGENLPPLMKHTNDNNQGRRILLAQQMLRIMRASPQRSLGWRENPFIRDISDALNLSATAASLLYGLCLLESSSISSALSCKARSEVEFARFAAVLLGIPNSEVIELCAPKGQLMSAGLPLCGRDVVTLGDAVLDGFRGDMDVPLYISRTYKIDNNNTFDLASFDILKESLQITEAILRSARPCHILLYGKPGTGKTELARSLIRAVGKNIMVVEPLSRTMHNDNRLSHVQLAAFFSEQHVIMVDEAEDILNTERRCELTNKDTPTKSLLNEFFDTCKAQIIWLVNDIGGIHESSMRRFHFKMRFDALSLHQRSHALDLILAKHGEQSIREEKFFKPIIQSDFLTPGILDPTIETYAATKHLLSDLPASKVIPLIVASHAPQKRTVQESLDLDSYSPEILNVSGDLDTLLDATKKFGRLETKPTHGINVLLHGLPGTGKSEYVKYIARESGLDLIVKRGSDLLSMFVGGTEAKIAEAFREAEKGAAILFVDEADTFFNSRETAVRSWEISQTNEFLNQMESHKVLLFCATNFLSHLDSAAMRRFHFKLEFKPILQEKRPQFFLDFFQNLLTQKPPLEELFQKLATLPKLTAGDFHAVKRRFSFRENNSLHWYDLVNELEGECKYKPVAHRQTIGF